MSIKKNIFAPWALGLGATRRAAMLLLVMMLTTATAWADNINVETAAGFGTLTDGKYTLVNGNTYTLTDDVNTAGYIYVPEGVTATIDLAGHTIDRGLTSADNNGSVIIVAGTLTITDSGTGGKIQGGYDAGDGYGYYTSCVKVLEDATLNLQGGTLIGRDQEHDYTVSVVENSNFTMTGGKITGGWTGVLARGNVTLTGGEISGNSYSGVRVGENFSISGNPVITENTEMNVDLRSSGGIRKINITGALTDGANIGITVLNPTDNSPVTVTNGYNTYNSVSPDTYFSLDNNGQIQISPYDYMTVVMGWNEDRTEVAVGTALYTVNFDMNGHGDDIDAVSLLSGYKVAEPTEPTADGWYFFGWYADDACTSQWNFNNAVTSNMTLHALWAQEAIYSFTLPEKMVIVSTTNAPVGGKYPVGTVIKFKVSSADYVVDGDVSDGTNTLTPDGDGIYTVTMGETDITITATIKKAVEPNKTLSGNESYTASDGDVLTGSTSGTVTIAADAKITLSDVTITGGIVCEETAEITLVGTNSVTGASLKAGIQVGGLGTTLTIKGNGSLTANGGTHSAGIGLSRAWDVDATGGKIVIEGGNITATGNGMGAGIGTGVCWGSGTDNTATIGNITIKGGTVRAIGGIDNGYPGNGIGKGGAYSSGHAVVGTITIYDGIDKVDASSISESVTYMHVENETETDVTANKSDYFTITEDGNRRVIEPKDDTDYTITIANGIEHGTLTGAATAKYTEKVTITATPDFGYRLSRLVVKDAQNNDVASTGNSFFMPKSNVTVSAVFEQGTHGTTEFAWGYYGQEQDSYVTEATIYDGVTTVNLQQGKVYFIGKDYHDGSEPGMGYYENTFRLDEDPYTEGRNIPYSGGTGSFMMGGRGKFRLNGDAGYYDITMTDVGNGKWNVSILKTAGQMDVVPDQTYTGSEITPEPLVIAGSLSLTKGTDYVYSYTNNTNFGTAKVRATFQGTYASLGYVEKEFTILPSTVMVSVTGSGTVTCGDRSATDGTSFGVMSEKGASVVLTLAPTDGYAARSVAYGYTNNSGTTASGIKLPISGTTATLTVPDDLKDGTGVTVTVTFAPALNGGADEASAVALTDATVTDLGGGWYKVENDISFDHTLNLLGDTHLIIAYGKTMTVNTASNRGIYSDYTLFVSGEGALNVTTTSSGIAVCVGNYVQTGATVTASGYIGIRCMDDFLGFDYDNDFTFSGGQLTATGSGGGGIDADNDITLSCTNATDFIQASSYSSGYGAVKIAEGNALTDGTEASNGMNGYSGTLTNEQRTAIGSKTLHRAVTTSYVEADGTLHENVIAIPLDDTMTTLAAGWYVVNSDVAYTGTVTLSGDVKLILGDGCTMSFGKEGELLNATIIECNSHNFTIYGQSGGTGWLKAYSATSSSINHVNNYTQYSGNVLIRHINAYCIDANNSVALLGGTLDVESGGGGNGDISGGSISILGGKLWAWHNGLWGPQGITLGYTNATDQIYVTIYHAGGMGLQIADGKTLVNDSGVIWSGALYDNQIEHGINNRTLKPLVYSGVTLTGNGYNVSATFSGSSETTLSIPVDVNVTSVTYNRTFTEGKPSTVMLPFSLGEGQTLTGGTLYKFTGVTKNETTGMWEATMTETATLQANTPYLLMPNNELVDGKVTFNLNWGTVTLNTTGGGNCLASDAEGWVFHGTYSKKLWNEVETHDYGFAATSGKSADGQKDVEAGQFVRLTLGASAKPMRCYLSYVGGPNQARALTRGAAATDEELPQSIIVRLVGANGQTTAIGTIDTKTGEMTFDSEAWYTLDGVRLSGKPTKKGLYINNGKKVVIK